MKLVAIVLLLFAFAKASPATQGTTPPASHPYVVPACKGAAAVPGYEQCHK